MWLICALGVFTRAARNQLGSVSRVFSLLTMTCKPQACRKSTVTFVLGMPLRQRLIIIQIQAD
jgi:hypothetical protein